MVNVEEWCDLWDAWGIRQHRFSEKDKWRSLWRSLNQDHKKPLELSTTYSSTSSISLIFSWTLIVHFIQSKFINKSITTITIYTSTSATMSDVVESTSTHGVCYYSVLSITKMATDCEIRGAYRKMALVSHDASFILLTTNLIWN